MAHGRVHIGTSGWSYDSWVGSFYDKNVKSRDLLAEYAKTFDSVELNNSFYKLPTPEAVNVWNAQSPSNFLFTCKASRFVTHMKKLKDPEEGIGRVLEAVRPLDGKLGPVLFQLPPRWRLNLERLGNFLQALPKGHRYTFEFREQSWLCDEVYELLKKHKIALCFYDLRGYQSPEVITADFVYLRLHGPNKEAYSGNYSNKALADYAQKINQWRKIGKDVYCYFDNDQKACAPFDALKLLNKVREMAA